MKKIFLALTFMNLLLTGCGKYIADRATRGCENPVLSTSNYSKAGELEKEMEKLTQKGVPGVVMAVISGDDIWSAAKGYAKIEDKTPMQVCHLQYLQSISKTYLAVAILKLYEQGKIKLDEPMTTYLPERFHKYIADAEKITVRMLLNHTSGIAEYNFAPAYVSYLMQHPEHIFTVEDYLGYIRKKGSQFPPGSKHVYTNTNYVILSLIADAVSGDHAKLIDETIFKPLALRNTYYRNDSAYLHYPLLVNSYWDRYSNGILENVSEMQRVNVSTLVGDDGIVTTPADAVKFLKALADGKLLNPSTMQEMKTWVNNKNGKPVYGLGLGYREINGVSGFGHSGGGIGAGSELYYFPQKNTCYFIAVNLGVVTSSPLHAEVEEILNNIHEILFR